MTSPVPTMASMLLSNSFFDGSGWDYSRVLHGGQNLELYRPLPAAAELLANRRVASIIDRGARKCLCVEIKWFIEPAEIREVLARSEELAKGVAQARKIAKMFSDNDSRLMSLLGIDQRYELLTMVGSVNFIGSQRIQHPEVPITKLWHLASEIQKRGRLSEVLEWLRSRSYLPRKDQDYKISEVAIQSGEWRSRWYGIAYANPSIEQTCPGKPSTGKWDVLQILR